MGAHAQSPTDHRATVLRLLPAEAEAAGVGLLPAEDPMPVERPDPGGMSPTGGPDESGPLPAPPDAVAIEDRVLVERFLAARGGGLADDMEAAFRMLLVRYQERVHQLVTRYTRDPLEAEDVTQEVFLKLFRKLDSFQWDSAFYTWLYRIAVNTAVDYMGKKRRRPVQLSEDVGDLVGQQQEPFAERGFSAAPSAEAPEAPLFREERAEVTHSILDELPDQYRTVLILREFEDLSYLEIAETLGCSLGTVESRLFRARARFRRILEERYPDLMA